MITRAYTFKGDWFTLKVIDQELNSITKNHLAALYERMQHHQDTTNSNKMIDLYDKLDSEQFIISFSGHFSAGKSSIINYLLGKDVLPNSPIPTSANIVKVSSGEGVARVFFNEEQPVEYKEPYNIDMIKDYCMDKDTISRIEISTSEPLLPANSFILDTPGIDAADDADRLMTESSLHLVDVLYYVMDYNHVQSEVNLYFLKEIQSQGIPIYLIINQIDKHNEAEIPFIEFDNSVKQTFDQWKIKPEKIYYTSALNQAANHNQIQEVKKELFELLAQGEVADKRIYRATEQIITAHREELETRVEETLVDYATEEMDNFDVHQFQQIQENLVRLNEILPEMKAQYYDELQLTLKNAYVMPAKLRDIAGEFLQTQRKDFKVGFFNSKRKTEEVRQEKLTNFLDPLLQTIDSTILWKLREKFVEILQAFHVDDTELLEKAQQFSILFAEEELTSLMKPGATINGNYILNYTNEVSASIKAKCRSAASQLWKQIEQKMKFQLNEQRGEYETTLHDFTGADEYLAIQTKLEEKVATQLNTLQEQLIEPDVDHPYIAEMEQIIHNRKQVVQQEVPIVNQPTETPESKSADSDIKNNPSVKLRSNLTVESIIDLIDETTNELNTMPAFESIIHDLHAKQTRLHNRELTIALFGAFSAGKSSFSNALFGEQILPVSPNPTTAVISRISPVTKEHGHGKVIITCKDDATLTEDLTYITKDLEPEAEQFHDLVDWIQRGHIHYNAALNNTYQSYLHAVLKGYDAHKDLLGKTIEISLEEFASYVTDESKACYIETVDLYYDCALTRKGITLVDTPGADSVNARHTNVSFDYIKEADAILYVTYFNHAITSADRDFLIQLGRVKEAFELDKMFFIVNASDLAQTETDLRLVLRYVEEQLLQFGIRHPKVFPVSSKLSLEEKLANSTLNDEMQSFEASFYQFIEEDLAALTIESAVWDITRAHKMLENFIATADLDETEQEMAIQQLKNKQASFATIVHTINTELAENRIVERMERQLHFVSERLFIRFHDMFSQFFNPTTITASGRKAQSQLEQNRNHFIDYVGYELLQEVRAVSLRMESFMKGLLKEFYEQIQHDITKRDDTFLIPSMQEPQFQTPTYAQGFTSVDMSLYADALKVFKNTKSFFEQNERETMKEIFYNIMQPEAKKYLDENKLIMSEHYQQQWKHEINEMKQLITKEMELMINHHINMMMDAVDLENLRAKSAFMQQLRKQVNEG